MFVAHLLVIAIVAILFGFIIWANVHHRTTSAEGRTLSADRPARSRDAGEEDGA